MYVHYIQDHDIVLSTHKMILEETCLQFFLFSPQILPLVIIKFLVPKPLFFFLHF